MIEIVRIGKNSIHDSTFDVNRPQGYTEYLLLLIKSPAKILVNDKWQNIMPNTAVIFNPGQKHRYCATDNVYIDDWMHFKSNTDLLGDHFPFGQPISFQNSDYYYELFHLIYKEYFGTSAHRKLIINNLTTALLDKIYDKSSIKAYPHIYYSLTGLREQIYQSPSKQWSVEDMAAQLNISVGYLHTVYRQYFNTTCMNDVIQSRIHFSCELLASNNMSLDKISQMCGYHSTEHFIRQFKTVIGTTPGKYRKNIQFFK